jgi:hypothetical protein
LLHALALAETVDAMTQDKVDNAVSAAVERRLFELYAKVAQANYASAARQFDAIAKQFTDAAATAIDVEADASTVIDKPDAVRSAYLEAEVFAHRLSALIELLIAAAELADVRIDGVEGTLPLCVDPGSLHRRRIWECWETTTGRTGRWGAGETRRTHQSLPTRRVRAVQQTEATRVSARAPPTSVVFIATLLSILKMPTIGRRRFDPRKNSGRLVVPGPDVGSRRVGLM